ncbi:hypothetical protein JCM14202_671 [Agrilactobacillus composti DSM 18527 = JCM 14202]|nr:hypothetical protein JCM14202_671 [Agrilactobacillus composti DSM 18527 = JCM 14202]
MKVIDRQLTYLTVGQTLLMGMLDAYTFSHFDGAFASAQTGNLVVFGVALTQQGWRAAASHLPIFLGFLIGAILAQLIRQQAASLRPPTRLNAIHRPQYRFTLSLVGITIWSQMAQLEPAGVVCQL